jgi:acetyl-CoA carboxylase alpha subunit
MTKAENRAAAKAYAEEKKRKFEEDQRQKAIAADLEPLRSLRDYLIFRRQSRVPADDLISAIDDYVEKLTGDRTTLHAKSSSIG